MSRETTITYINKSLNKDLPKIFIFARNEIPSFDSLTNGTAWKVIRDIGQDSMSTFTYSDRNTIFASWDEESNRTKALDCQVGKRYTVEKNNTGVILKENGRALHGDEIELENAIRVKNGVSAYLCKSGKTLVKKDVVAFGQKASFRISKKIYWGIASEIEESGSIYSAVLDSNLFFEQNLENVTSSIVSLNGNAEEGYSFKIEEQD